MSTSFQAALLSFIAAERNAHDASARLSPEPYRERLERTLAQAGDVLEREVRQMIREERERV